MISSTGYWLGFGQGENIEDNYGDIGAQLETRFIVAHNPTSKEKEYEGGEENFYDFCRPDCGHHRHLGPLATRTATATTTQMCLCFRTSA